MASTAAPTTPKAGLRNTVRFRWTKKNTPLMQREVFGRLMLMGQLKLKVEHVFCLQTNMQEKSYDVTFSSQGVAEDVLGITRARAGERPFNDFEVLNLDRPNFRVITVHMYNPYVTREQIVAFLSFYGEVFPGSRRLNDPLGFWTGRTQFHVLLKEDPSGIDGMKHPPAFFSLAADRGFLFYSRQPPFCRKCKQHGHSEGACGFVWCNVCKCYGHETRECPFPKACSGCGRMGHLIKDCPERAQTYAEVASPGGEEVEGLPDDLSDSDLQVDVEEETSSGHQQQREEGEWSAETEPSQEEFYLCQEVGGKEELVPPAPKEKTYAKKKGGARKLKKSGTFGGNGHNKGEEARASKRLRVGECKGVEVVGEGVEFSGGGGAEGMVEETQRDSGGQEMDTVLALGQDMELFPMVSPVPELEEAIDRIREEEKSGGENTGAWGDSEPPLDVLLPPLLPPLEEVPPLVKEVIVSLYS